jgi:hypothetical protein
MTDHGRKPIRWANDLNKILSAAFRDERFPVPVEDIVCEYSRLKFPTSPVVAVEGRALGKFEGALYPVHDGKAWAVIYNNAGSEGRKRFTIAHEFGHYLMHRPLAPPEGFQCSENSVTFRDGDEIEQEADEFAAYLLMPFDDFRKQLDDDAVPGLEDLSALAERYGVSLISCVLRWLEYTRRRSMIVISRDEFVLWAKPSKPAFQSGIFIKTRGVPPVPVPANSLIGRRDFADIAREGVQHPAGIWCSEECTEITWHSDKYDQAITILHYGRNSARSYHADEPDQEDTFDRFNPKPRGRLE